MSIKQITADDLCSMNGQEGLILQGCGDPQEWLDGINELLTDAGILKNGSKFENISVFKHENLTNILFSFKDSVQLDMGKLAMWRLQTHESFGGKWLSDYVDNRPGGFATAETAEKKRPDCKLIGKDGNIFNLIGIASRTLRQNGMAEQAVEMRDRIRASDSYDKALCIIGEYVNITGSDESEDMDEGMDMAMLPNDHKAKWFAGAALNTAEQSMASVMSTALSRLNSFLDSELEQLLCFDTEIDAEKLCNEKSAIFVIMPEENPNTFFMISLIIQQLYREILAVADENGGKLKNRCVFFCDEFGTLPKIESAEMMFSAARSRRLQIVPIIQSFSQLDKNYGKEGAEIIVDNTQITLFGGFAPNSSSAEVLSKALGSRTVMSGSVSRSKNDPSQSLQMIERPLMTPDELKSMPKGQFVVMKTGVHPMRVKLKLFFKWGIKFNEDKPYTVEDNGGREVEYAEKNEIIDGIMQKYNPEWLTEEDANVEGTGGMNQTESQSHAPQQTPQKKVKNKSNGGAVLESVPPSRRKVQNKPQLQEVKADGQT